MPDYPDFTITALLKGTYAEKPKALAVDSAGNMIAMLKGQYDDLPKNVELDEFGNININLVAQGLSELINRLKYGASDRLYDVQNITGTTPVNLATIRGMGQIYVAYVACYDSDFDPDDAMVVKLDEEETVRVGWEFLKIFNLEFNLSMPYSLIAYDPITPYLKAAFVPGFTFESKFELDYEYTGPGTVSVYHDITYSLVKGPY